jgi:hypothetical protein
MTYNIAAQSQEIQQQFELQKKASLWVYWVNTGKPGWTRERVRVELAQIADDAEREGLRGWLRHYDNIANGGQASQQTHKQEGISSCS